jgi:predicted AAA+ superfamily ATPase
MGAFTDAPASEILIGNNIFEEYKGAFTENFVLQQLQTVLGEPPYYFSADNSMQELDFIFQNDNVVMPIEVKAEENLRAKSLKVFCMEHPGVKGIRISMSPYRQQDWMINLPLYSVERILQIKNR